MTLGFEDKGDIPWMVELLRKDGYSTLEKVIEVGENSQRSFGVVYVGEGEINSSEVRTSNPLRANLDTSVKNIVRESFMQDYEPNFRECFYDVKEQMELVRDRGYELGYLILIDGQYKKNLGHEIQEEKKLCKEEGRAFSGEKKHIMANATHHYTLYRYFKEFLRNDFIVSAAYVHVTVSDDRDPSIYIMQQKMSSKSASLNSNDYVRVAWDRLMHEIQPREFSIVEEQYDALYQSDRGIMMPKEKTLIMDSEIPI